LGALSELRQQFTRLHEPSNVSACWHQIGIVYQEMGKPEAAEDGLPEIISD
jgi:hypothetical protein